MSVLLSGYTRQCAEKMHSNQDEFGAVRVYDPNHKEITLAVVADGISLGYDGSFASYNTVLWLLNWAHTYIQENVLDIQSVAQEIQNQMMMYNHRLNDYSDLHSDKDTCCTVCGLITDENYLMVFNAGDSRLYELMRDGRILCLTKDDKADDGYSIAMHIGGKNDNDIKLTFSVDEFHADSIYILCSDGFYKRCSFADIHNPLFGCTTRKQTVGLLEQIADQLVRFGESDDITALVVTRSD